MPDRGETRSGCRPWQLVSANPWRNDGSGLPKLPQIEPLPSSRQGGRDPVSGRVRSYPQILLKNQFFRHSVEDFPGNGLIGLRKSVFKPTPKIFPVGVHALCLQRRAFAQAYQNSSPCQKPLPKNPQRSNSTESAGQFFPSTSAVHTIEEQIGGFQVQVAFAGLQGQIGAFGDYRGSYYELFP